MKAPPDAQLRLLDLADLDAALDRLAHRRRTLPVLADVERLAARRAELADAVVAAETEAADITREQAKADSDVEQVRARLDRDQARLDSGQGSAKELESIQHEIGSLRRRQADLEDVELEVMERLEAVQGRLDGVRREHAEVAAELSRAEAARDEAVAGIDAEAATTRGRREEVAADLPADLLAFYTTVGGNVGGIGAAALHRGRCGGCHLDLGQADLRRLRAAPPDEVVRCEECRRILVRTPESGL